MRGVSAGSVQEAGGVIASGPRRLRAPTIDGGSMGAGRAKKLRIAGLGGREDDGTLWFARGR
jgi:hypothetical protein